MATIFQLVTTIFLLGKSCVYNDNDTVTDSDSYNKAVHIIGKKEVALSEITMGLPLWKEVTWTKSRMIFP